MIMKRSYVFSGIVVISLVICIASAIAVYYFSIIIDYASLSYLTIDRVIVTDSSIYVRGIIDCTVGMGGCNKGKELFYVSNDFGGTWQATQFVPADVSNYFRKPVDDIKVVCYENEDPTCYRIVKGKEQIQISFHDGITWRTDWKMPFGRKYYMRRHSEFPFRGVEPDISPYDIALLESDAGSIVIAAMGNQGVLIRNNDGKWDRIAVLNDYPRSAPTPYFADSMEELTQNIFQEGLLGSLFSFGHFIILTIFGWVNLHWRLGERFRYSALFFYLPFIVLCGICYYLMSLYYQNEVYFWMVVKGEWIDYKPEYVYSLPFLGLIMTWGMFIAFTKKHAVGLLSSLVPLLSTLILLVGILSPLALWALGIIPIYTLALILSIVLGSLVVHNGIQLQIRINTKATQSNNGRQVSAEVLS